MLGVVKMANVAFDAAYSNTGYMHFSSGGFLQPGDYHGLSTILTPADQVRGHLRDFHFSQISTEL